MISATTLKPDSFRDEVTGPDFTVSSPKSNPLVASVPVLISKHSGGIDVVWQEPAHPVSTSPSAGGVLEGMAQHAKKEVSRAPQSSRAHTNLGLALLNLGQWQDAIIELRTACDLDSHNYLASISLANALVKTGDLDGAKPIYEELSQSRTNDGSALLNLAYIAARKSEYQKAAEILQATLDDRSAFPHYLHGIMLLQLGKTYPAIAELKKAAKLELVNPVFHHSLGVAYAVSGMHKHASREFKSALALAPHWRESVHGLSRIYLQQKDSESCINLLSEYLQNTPNDLEARERLALAYYEQARYSSARSHLLNVLQALPKDADKSHRARLQNNVGAFFMSEGKLDEAEKWLRAATAENDTSSEIPYANLGRLFLSKEDYLSASEILVKCKKLFPQSQAAAILISWLMSMLDRHDKAIRELERFLDSKDVLSETYLNLGWLYDWVGKNDLAIEILGRGHAAYPLSPEIVNNLAHAYLSNGDTQSARSILESLPKDRRQSVALTATRGLMHLWEGNLPAAKQLYAQAELKARANGDRGLASSVRQKMHLEFARAYCRVGNIDAALTEIEKGLQQKAKPLSYANQLRALYEQCKRQR